MIAARELDRFNVLNSLLVENFLEIVPSKLIVAVIRCFLAGEIVVLTDNNVLENENSPRTVSLEIDMIGTEPAVPSFAVLLLLLMAPPMPHLLRIAERTEALVLVSKILA